jgi:hypothetical protein
MTASTSTVPAAEPGDHVLAARRLRDFSFAQVILLVLQTVLGMRVNLFVQVPAGDQGKGLLSSFGDAMSKGPAEIAAHAGFGLLVFINACLLVVFSLTVRGVWIKITSLIGWLAIAGAAVSGAAFINSAPNTSSTDDASFAMALLTMVALVCYAWNLFATPRIETEPPAATSATTETAQVATSEAEATSGSEAGGGTLAGGGTVAKSESENAPEVASADPRPASEATTEPTTATATATDSGPEPETTEPEPETTESATEPEPEVTES